MPEFILKMSDAVQSIKPLYKLLSIYRGKGVTLTNS